MMIKFRQPDYRYIKNTVMYRCGHNLTITSVVEPNNGRRAGVLVVSGSEVGVNRTEIKKKKQLLEAHNIMVNLFFEEGYSDYETEYKF